jgi:hypothetical protein
VISNHYHVILHVDTEHAKGLSEQEVIERWERLFSLPVIVQRYLAQAPITQAERDTVSELLTKWRIRLHDISWFMRCINEPIARQANKEDGCTGRYWEGRYKSQALLDEKALAACMAYVDLNPVRAGLVETPEQSEYTSIQVRSHQVKQSLESTGETPPSGLLPFAGYPRRICPGACHFGSRTTLNSLTGQGVLSWEISVVSYQIINRLFLSDSKSIPSIGYI